MSEIELEHTPGPWRIERSDRHSMGIFSDAWGFIGFLNSGLPDEANAKRIVACVNFLDGISIEKIEKHWLTIFESAREHDSLIAERDALREALGLIASGADGPTTARSALLAKRA